MTSGNDDDRRAKEDITNDGGEKEDITAERTLDRRSYLKLSGGAAAAALGTTAAAGTAAAETTVDGISFDRTVNIVEDFGADNTGSESIDSELSNAIGNNTLIRFPEGKYKITQRHTLPSGNNIGFLGEGQVVFVPPNGSNFSMFASGVNSPANQVLFKNIDFDIRADNTVTGLRFNTRNGVHVENVEYHGRGTHSNGEVANALTVTISNSSASGVVKNLVAKKGSSWARYKAGEGRIGIGVFTPHSGTLKVIDCHLEEFGNNGMYTSRHNGRVQVEGGVFRNNNVCGVRISGKGNYVDGATIEVDPEKYTGPRESGHESSAFGMRAVWINGRKYNKEAAAEVRNCDIVLRDNPARQNAIEVREHAKSLVVRNTRIEHDVDNLAAIGSDPNGYPIKMDGVSITGNADGGAAVSAPSSPDTVVQNCCIEQTGSNRDGVKLSGSDGSVVRDSNISVSGEAVNINNSDVDTSNITQGDSCPVPSLDGGSGNSTEGSWGSDLANTVTVQSTGTERATYEFTVSEELQAGLDANLTGAEYPDSVEGTTASGSIAQGGQDNYHFDGEITALTLDGPADVLVNGEQLDLTQFDTGSSSDSGSTDSTTDDSTDSTTDLSRTVRVESTGTERASYEVAVSEAIEAGSDANLTGAEYPDSVEGTTASGSIAQYGQDDYNFAGDVTALSVDGPADVYIDGEQVDPANFGSSGSDDSTTDDGTTDDNTDSSTDPSRTVRVESTGTERASYEFTVSDVVEPGEDANLTNAEYPDSIDGTTASGSIAQYGQDDYNFAGDVTALSVDGPADVYVDGEQVDPANFGSTDSTSDSTDLPNLLVIDGSQAESISEYSFEVTGELEKDSDAGSVNDNDIISDGGAYGQVLGGIDAYRFSGDITSLRLSGTAAVTFEEE